MAEAGNALPVPSGTGRSQPLRVRYRGAPAARSVPCVRPTSDDTVPFPEREAPVRAAPSRPVRPAAASWGVGSAVRTDSLREVTAGATAGRPSPALPRAWGGRLWGKPRPWSPCPRGRACSARKVPESCRPGQGFFPGRRVSCGMSRRFPGARRPAVRPALTAIDHPEQAPLSFFANVPRVGIPPGGQRRRVPEGPPSRPGAEPPARIVQPPRADGLPAASRAPPRTGPV